MRSQSNPDSSTDVASALRTMPPIGQKINVTDLPLEVIKEKPPMAQASPTPNIVNIKRGGPPRKQTSNVSNEVETPKMASFKRREKPPTLQQALKTDSSLSHLERKAVKLVDESKFRAALDVESTTLDPDTTLHNLKVNRKTAEMALDAVIGAPDEQQSDKPYDSGTLTNEEKQ